jgi:hypothetical protein
MSMTHNVTLTITSLLAMLFFTFHHADDVVRGMAPGGLVNVGVMVGLVVWLYGTLVLAGRLAGLVITMGASLFAAAIPIVHMTGSGLAGGRIAGSSGAFFFVWTLIGLGASAWLSVALSAIELRRLRHRQPGPIPGEGAVAP